MFLRLLNNKRRAWDPRRARMETVVTADFLRALCGQGKGKSEGKRVRKGKGKGKAKGKGRKGKGREEGKREG